MKRVSQTLKVVLALFVAIFANGTLTNITAYAAVPITEPEISTTLPASPVEPELLPSTEENSGNTTPIEPQPLLQPLSEQPVIEPAAVTPTIEACTSTSSELVNTKAGFATYDDQRANGHYQFKASGVRLYTDSNSDTGPRTDGGLGNWNTDKVAWYHAVDYPLTQVGIPSMNYTATFGPQPGLQLVIDFDNNGTLDGILVGESVYGNDWWLPDSASSAQFVKDNAPNTGTGYGSLYHGTLNEWLAKFPTATVKAVGFSLGSGVYADGILKSLTFGCHTWNFGLKQVQASAPKVKTDTCGTKNDTYTIPENEGVVYSVNGNIISSGTHETNGKAVILVNASPADGYTLKGKTTWILVFSIVPCIPVTPRTPDFYDYCGTSKTDSVVIPFTIGVIYKIDGNAVHAGTYPVTSVSIVTAEAQEGFIIREGASSAWNHVFTNSNCITIEKSSEPVTDTNMDGIIGLGDIVTWKITVTNNSTNKFENFRVQIEDSSATLQNDGLIPELSPGKTVTLSATTKLTTTDLQACKATNTAQFTAWYTRTHHQNDTEEFGGNRSQFLNDASDSNTYDLSGSVTAETTFTCPTPGHGDGGNTGTTTTSVEELPNELPATGPSNMSNPLVVLAAMAAAYGATYFIQRRRELTTN